MSERVPPIFIEHLNAHLQQQVRALIFASLAEFERELIRERTNAGLAAARARGRKGGRPKGVDEKKRKAALALKRDPNYSVKEICEIVLTDNGGSICPA